MAKTGEGLLAAQLLRGDTCDAGCPSRAVLVSMTGKWSVLILVALGGGTLRFAELRRRVSGVSERMLAESLRQLARHGLVERRSLPVMPPHVDYRLTPLGREAADHLTRLTDWIECNVARLVPAAAADQDADPRPRTAPSAARGTAPPAASAPPGR